MPSMLTRERLCGVWPALITPWTSEDTLDEDRFVAEISAYAGTGVHGLYTGGTTGEFYAQDDQTFERIAVIACRQGHQLGLPVQIGCTALSTRTVVRRIEKAVAAGADGIQLAIPFWMELSDSEVVEFFRTSAAAAGSRPLILYNTTRAARKLPAELIGRLAAEVPMLWGIKDTGCSVEDLGRLLAVTPETAVFGAEHDLARKFAHGGRGTYSSITGLNAAFVVRLWQLCVVGRFPEAKVLEDQLSRYTFELLVPMVREGLRDSAIDRVQRMAGGVDVGLRCQLPYRSATVEHIDRLREWCRLNVPDLLNR